MKQTPEDRHFAFLFAQALRPHVSAEIAKGESMVSVATKLGVTAPALQKYLDGGTVPSLRTIARAYHMYKISVPYDGIEIGRGQKRKRTGGDESQLLLPFEIITPTAQEHVQLALLPTGSRRYQLQVTLRIAR